MIQSLTHVTLMVHDQDEAVKFYESLDLGFYKHIDNPMGETMRWVTLALRSQPQIEILLQPTSWGDDSETPEQRAAMVGKGPGFVFNTSDCRGDIESLRAKGVKISMEPTDTPWGIQAVFADLYGNLHMVNQNHQPANS